MKILMTITLASAAAFAAVPAFAADCGDGEGVTACVTPCSNGMNVAGTCDSNGFCDPGDATLDDCVLSIADGFIPNGPPLGGAVGHSVKGEAERFLHRRDTTIQQGELLKAFQSRLYSVVQSLESVFKRKTDGAPILDIEMPVKPKIGMNAAALCHRMSVLSNFYSRIETISATRKLHMVDRINGGKVLIGDLGPQEKIQEQGKLRVHDAAGENKYVFLCRKSSEPGVGGRESVNTHKIMVEKKVLATGAIHRYVINTDKLVGERKLIN